MKRSCNIRRGTSTLEFEDHKHDGEYYIRGGICWPEGADGFTILAGQNVDNKNVLIFRQFSFLTVDNVLRPDRSIEYEGLSSFINNS